MSGYSRIKKQKKNEVIVQTASDFPSVIDSSKVYFIDGEVDMGDRELIVPETGMYLEGHGYGISVLFTSQDNKTLFKTGPGTYSGDFIVGDCTLYASGANSKIFDLDNDNNFSAIEFNTCNLGVFSVPTTSIGRIANYRQIRTGDFAAIRYLDGFTFDGAFTGMAFNDAILLANQPNTTFLQEGVGLSISAGLSSDMNALSLDPTSSWCDFSPSDFAAGAEMDLNGFRTNVPSALPNIDADDPKAYFKSCVGIQNTYVGGYWTLSAESSTTLPAADTYTKAAGTTLNIPGSHFEAVGDNALRYIGARDIQVGVSCALMVETSAREALSFAVRHYDASAGSFTNNVDERPVETLVNLAGNRVGQTTLLGVVLLSTNDIIEVWVKNINNTNAPTIRSGTKLVISERT